MNIADAAYATVHDYPGGSESLGPRVGMVPAVLRNKVNPHSTNHHLSIADADRLMGVTGDHRMLQALAASHGYVLQRAEHSEGEGVLSAHLALSAAKGELSAALLDALRDGRITQNEATLIASAGAAVQAAIVHLVSTTYAEARPAALRAVGG